MIMAVGPCLTMLCVAGCGRWGGRLARTSFENALNGPAMHAVRLADPDVADTRQTVDAPYSMILKQV
jgi:hypothetical protein